MEQGKTLVVSANPISPTEEGLNKVKTRVELTRFVVVFAGVGLTFFVFGMWSVDGVMDAMGLPALVLLGCARWMVSIILKG